MGQIFGAIARQAAANPARALEIMNSDLGFWQPDSQGRYTDAAAAIGSRLLYNTPEAHLEQLPLVCPQERYVLSCVARLDNREALAALLGYAPEMTGTIPDARFILDAYIKWQEACVQHLIGDFAIAVWDKAGQKLFLARDHIGVKPLFYTQTEDFFLFASDINAFRTLCRLPEAHLNEAYLANLLTKEPNPVPETCYSNVSRLLPAHYYVLQHGAITTHAYWKLQPAVYPELKTEADYYQRFRELLLEAVRCRLRSTGNIGCELSGGLDSATITILAARLLGAERSRLHTLSYIMPEEAKAFDDSWVNEEPEQEATIEAAGIARANVHKLTRAWFDDPLEEMDYATEVSGGITDTDCYWTEALRREARRQQVRVILSGFPGDELVSASGGAWFFDILAKQQYRTVLSLIREKPVERLKGLARYLFLKYVYYTPSKALILQQDKTDFLSSAYKRKHAYARQRPVFQPDFDIFLSARIMRPHTCLRMESEGLYALRQQMETRYPLADIRLLQFALSIPSIFHKDAPQSRHVFRKAAEGILPDKVRLRQNKKGAPLVFHRFKFFNDMHIFIASYREPARLKEMIHTEKLLQTAQDNIRQNDGVAPSSLRTGFWLIRFLSR